MVCIPHLGCWGGIQFDSEVRYFIWFIEKLEKLGEFMFKDIVQIDIPKDSYSKYIKQAESLGYRGYYNMNSINGNNGNKIVLYPSNIYNIFPDFYVLDYKTITEEEFFGEPMLEKIDSRILSVLVNLTCETLDSFSAYDITSLLRSRLPNFNIIHDEVRETVVKYAIANNLEIKDNGTYLVYTNPIKINFKPVITTSNTQGFIQPPKQSKLKSLLELKKQKETNKTKSLQSEDRLSLTSLVRKQFPNSKTVYIIKNKNNILVKDVYVNNSIAFDTNSEIRIRTGFKSNSTVSIGVSPGTIQITPC